MAISGAIHTLPSPVPSVDNAIALPFFWSNHWLTATYDGLNTSTPPIPTTSTSTCSRGCSQKMLFRGRLTLSAGPGPHQAVTIVNPGLCVETRVSGSGFYSASALLAMQTAIIARGYLSFCPSVRHIPVFCPDEWKYDKYDRVVFSIRWDNHSSFWRGKIRIFAGNHPWRGR